MHTSEDYWLSREEVAGRFKLPTKTLATWASEHKGPRYAIFGRHARYKLSDVIAWEEAQLTGGAA